MREVKCLMCLVSISKALFQFKIMLVNFNVCLLTSNIRWVHYPPFILARFSLMIIVNNNLLYFFKKIHVENHIPVRLNNIMLYHYENGWKAAQSFRDLNKLLSVTSVFR